MSFNPKKQMKQDLLHQQQNSSWLQQKIYEFKLSHERLKHKIHNGWRMPLPPWGRAVMGCVYFSIPVIFGYTISTWAVAQSEATVEERFGKQDSSPQKVIQGLGDKTIVEDSNTGEKRIQKVGAGGWGGGVHLVTSDQQTQDVNKVNLERFLKQQRRRLKKKKAMEEQEEDKDS